MGSLALWYSPINLLTCSLQLTRSSFQSHLHALWSVLKKKKSVHLHQQSWNSGFTKHSWSMDFQEKFLHGLWKQGCLCLPHGVGCFHSASTPKAAQSQSSFFLNFFHDKLNKLGSSFSETHYNSQIWRPGSSSLVQAEKPGYQMPSLAPQLSRLWTLLQGTVQEARG